MVRDEQGSAGNRNIAVPCRPPAKHNRRQSGQDVADRDVPQGQCQRAIAHGHARGFLRESPEELFDSTPSLAARSLISLTMRSTTLSIEKPVVSITTASAAGFIGAITRVASRASRSRCPCRTDSKLAVSPLASCSATLRRDAPRRSRSGRTCEPHWEKQGSPGRALR